VLSVCRIASLLFRVRNATWTPSTIANASSTARPPDRHRKAIAFIDPSSPGLLCGGVAR